MNHIAFALADGALITLTGGLPAREELLSKARH